MHMRSNPNGSIPLFARVLAAAIVFSASVCSTLAAPPEGKGKGGGGGEKDSPPVQYSVTVLQNTLGGSKLYVVDMNDSLEIVGGQRNPDDESRAFVYTPDQGVVDLNSVVTAEQSDGWVMVSAMAINELGQITGRATKDGETRPYTLDLYGLAPPPHLSLRPTPSGASWSEGMEINNLGEIVARYQDDLPPMPRILNWHN